jgi:hypothetical protein
MAQQITWPPTAFVQTEWDTATLGYGSPRGRDARSSGRNAASVVARTTIDKEIRTNARTKGMKTLEPKLRFA